MGRGGGARRGGGAGGFSVVECLGASPQPSIRCSAMLGRAAAAVGVAPGKAVEGLGEVRR
jgi:hypothetical protein